MNVGLRVMALDEPQTGSKIPDWLIAKGIKGQGRRRQNLRAGSQRCNFIAYAQKLLTALGQRYDGNPELAFIDIGMVSGEWHNSNFSDIPPLMEKYTPEQLNRYVDMHFDSFRKRRKSC